MNQPTDPWYVRLPDGRVIRAANTSILRRQLDAGRIPYSSTVRRTPEEEWVKLEWTEEFADLADKQPLVNGAKKQVSGKKKKKRRVVSAGTPITAGTGSTGTASTSSARVGFCARCWRALDSTLVPKKLTVLVYAGFALGFLAALSRLPWPDLGMYQIVIAWVLAFAGLIVVTALSGILTRMTFLELSELRPARLCEGMHGLSRRTVRLAVGGAVGVGRSGAAPRQPALGDGVAGGPLRHAVAIVREIIADIFTVASLVLEFALWPLFGLAFLLGPILVVEECSIRGALGRGAVYCGSMGGRSWRMRWLRWSSPARWRCRSRCRCY